MKVYKCTYPPINIRYENMDMFSFTEYPIGDSMLIYAAMFFPITGSGGYKFWGNCLILKNKNILNTIKYNK